MLADLVEQTLLRQQPSRECLRTHASARSHWPSVRPSYSFAARTQPRSILPVCGIYGIINLDGRPADPAALSRDGARDDPSRAGRRRCACRRPVCHGHATALDHRSRRRPSTARPTRDGTLWLVCNGEIYNFRELRRELEAAGHRSRPDRTAKSIIHAYAEHGDDFVERVSTACSRSRCGTLGSAGY